jgi:hypothetical protein
MRKLWICRGILMAGMLGTPLTLKATNGSDSLKSGVIKTFPEHFHVQGVFISRSLLTELRDIDSRTKLNFRPNARQHVGAGIYLWGVLLQAAVQVNKNALDEDKYGSTESFDLILNGYFRRWGGDVAVQNYKGFYISNPQGFLDNWDKSQPRPQRADKKTHHFVGNLFYVFQPERFSYRAAFKLVERQTQSGGSPLLIANIFNSFISADSTLIPTEVQDEFGDFSLYRGGNTATISLMPGYSHTFVHKYWFLNVTAAMGPGHQWMSYRLESERHYDLRIRLTAQVRAAMGYHSDKWFAAITFASQPNVARLEGFQITHASTNFRVMAGVRFPERGFLRKHPDRKKFIGF